ncbi:hypothetical protein LC065_18365 [Halobacillus litoralis]|uniref:hypothetical protein n=1 Tax=Halobacillus litoralis TaxID=45668 RepID=UPI001CFC7923|nr:hypothetical protein [Halobacillus litoralis]WLR47452.1 hypothetical protein LC065_18365 [Halobacillus litoralis]
MKKFIHHLRKNEKHLLIAVFFSIAMVIIGGILTGTSLSFGRIVLISSIAIMVYLLWFIGVDPIWKGFGLLVFAFGITFIFSELVAMIPINIYDQWLSADTVKGVTFESVFFLLMLKLISKWAGFEPYIEYLVNKEKKKESRS